jgi:hypothetical protein
MALGTPYEDRHLIEAHSNRGETKNTARYFNALQGFARRGEDLDRVVWRALRCWFAT